MAEMRSVPAVRLGHAYRLQNVLTDFEKGRTTIEQILADAPEETVVIPVESTTPSDSFTIECFVNPDVIYGFRFGVNHQPLHVLVLDSYTKPRVYSFFPCVLYQSETRRWYHIEATFHTSGSYPGIHNTTRYAKAAQQLNWELNYDNLAFSSPDRYYPIPTSWRRGSQQPKIVGIILGGWIYAECLYAEVRLWNLSAKNYPYKQRVGHRFYRRLDGSEPGQIGYWKLAEGTGTELRDSGRSGTVGKLTGGTWIDAAESGLNLDCTLEDVQVLRDAVRKKKEQYMGIATAAAARNQEADLLDAQISAVRDEHDAMEKKLTGESENVLKQLSELEAEHLAWQTDIKEGGRVALDTFGKTVAEEVDRTSQRLDEAKSLYSLQGVDLEVKMLPVQTAEEEDFRVVFPAIDDPNVQSDQLSTISLNFATRPKARDRPQGTVPDVQRYTELAARRRLAQDGFRVEVVDEAVAREEEVGRVRGQAPEPNSERPLDSIVTLVVGRASGIALATGTPPGKE